MKKIFTALSFFITLTVFSTVHAGEVSLGVNFGFVSTDLTDMDNLISAANSGSTGPITTKALGNGLEVVGVLGYRFDGTSWAIHLAPSYYFNGSSGTDTNGDNFDYRVDAIIAMPLLRIYALENEFMSLYFQGGVGWGQIYGKIDEADDQTDFSGSNLGYQAGLGLNMCYEKTHCLNLEANLRILEVERNIVDDTTSSGSHANGQITQSGAGQELEINGRDLQVNLSGTQVMAGYVFKF